LSFAADKVKINFACTGLDHGPSELPFRKGMVVSSIYEKNIYIKMFCNRNLRSCEVE
jgi:hypothetical protein